MNEKFKEYTDKGITFLIYSSEGTFYIDATVLYGWDDAWGEPYVKTLYIGDNLDHAFAACDLWLEGE